MTERLDLTQTTFIIPLCIESEDRYKNAQITLSYLCKHLNTNIIVYEYDADSKLESILKNIDVGNTKIDHWFVKNVSGNKLFHRTKFLNEMLFSVKTECVVNYDIDMVLESNSYQKCQEFILGGHDLVYPYFWGDSQYQIFKPGRNKFEKTLDLKSLDLKKDCNLTRNEYGLAQFFKTSSYKNGGGEDENMFSYGPEDLMRGERFKKLGYVVVWSNFFSFHIEHSRTEQSSSKNPMFEHNMNHCKFIQSLSKEKLQEYYSNASYLEKYKKC